MKSIWIVERVIIVIFEIECPFIGWNVRTRIPLNLDKPQSTSVVFEHLRQVKTYRLERDVVDLQRMKCI